MRLNTRPGRRLAGGAGVIAALALGLAGITSSALPSNAVQPGSASTDPTSINEPGAGDASEFPGYNGYVDPDKADAAAVADDTTRKPVDRTLGEPGGDHDPDVPGAGSPTEEPDSAEAQLTTPSDPSPSAVADVTEALDARGTARVIVMTDARQRLEGDLGKSAVRAQRSAIASSLDDLQATLRGTGSTKVSELTSVPSAVYEVTDDGLNALLDDPNVVSVVLDGSAHGTLASSTGVIDSDLLNSAGVLGNNFDGSTTGAYQVAIIDSGVDGQHNAFTGRIVRQGCFVTDSSCPGNSNAFIGAPGGEECTHSTDCDHGTHVGSIAAGGSFTGGHEGVARGSGIVAIKVAQDNPTSPRWTAQFSAIDQALQHVLNLKNSTNPNLASVNLSIGTNAVFTAGNPACNAVNPSTSLLFGQLQAAGVGVVVAAGNNGSNNAMSFPGCATNAFAIGATTDADVPASFTNSSAGLRWWAPGVSIDAAVPTGNNHGSKDGTSMAAPHVTGALALLRECVDGNGVPQSNAAAAADLDATGVNVTRNGVTRKRINVLDAATRNVNNNDFANAENFAGNGPINDFDFTVCSDTEPGEPGPFSLDNGIWWNWTPATTGTATISTEDNGANVTTFDTTLAVYTGNSLGTLSNVAADDDSGTGLRSSVTFPVNGGTTYRIKVDGFAAANGLLNLHIENGPPPQCFGVPATRVGTAGNDVINGTAGADVIVAGAGNDTINGRGGNDRICGDAGVDTINGGSGNDFVLGGSAADVINGGSGNDTLVGNPGAGSNDDGGDTINGGSGDDFIDGWFGDDVLSGGPGDDQLRGEAGNDTVTYAASPAGVNANLTTNTASGEGSDTFVLVENLTGSPFRDRFAGDANANTLIGGNGKDGLNGGAGNDVLNGGNGNDVISGRAGDDTIDGGAGTDTVGYEFAPAAVNVNLVTGLATGDGNDTLASVENLKGSPAGDTLRGNGSKNRLLGLNGNDRLLGGGAKDVLAGGAGNDRVFGQSGNDRLFGNAGRDRLNGGSGRDRCHGGSGVDTARRCEVKISIP